MPDRSALAGCHSTAEANCVPFAPKVILINKDKEDKIMMEYF